MIGLKLLFYCYFYLHLPKICTATIIHFKIIIYLLEKQGNGEIEADRYISFTGLLPKGPQWPGTVQVKAESQESIPCLPYGWQLSNCLSHSLLPLSIHIIKNLNREGSQDWSPETANYCYAKYLPSINLLTKKLLDKYIK